jgi:hypothetical protein
MIQTVYRVLLYPWVLISYFNVPSTRRSFDSLEEVNEYHFSYDYDLDTVVFCYTWLPAILLILPVILFGRWIDGKAMSKLRGARLDE